MQHMAGDALSGRAKPFAWLLACCIALLAQPAGAITLDQNCTATILNRTALVAENGTFALGNVPVPSGPFRVRVFCAADRGTDDPDASRRRDPTG